MGFLGFGGDEGHQLTVDYLAKFWRHAGNDAFDRFRKECIDQTLRNVMFPGEALEFNDVLLGKWRDFEVREGLKQHTPKQLIAAFAKEWPPSLATENKGFYKEILRIDGVRKAEELLRLAKSIDADGNLDGIAKALQLLSGLLDGPSAAELYLCLCQSGVYDGLWRKQFLSLVPQAEAYLPPCSATEVEFRKLQLGSIRERLLSLPLVKGNLFYENLVKDIISINEKISALPYEDLHFSVEPPATEQDIREHEREIGTEIPAQLREVLLRVSGSFEFHWRVKGDRKEAGCYDGGWVEWKLRDIKTVDPGDYGIEEEDIDDYGWINVLHVFPFCSGDFVAIGLDGERAGKIYYYDHGSYKFTHIADSFNDFIQEMAQRDFCNLEMVLLYFEVAKKAFSFDAVPKHQALGVRT